MAEPSSAKLLYLVDGTSQLFRAYYALPPLTSPSGLPTHAVYGFVSMLRKLIQDESPEFLAVVFDPKGPVFRHEQYEQYKANRPPSPEDLNVQVPYAKQACEVLGVHCEECKGYEADDVIATYASQARASGFEVIVVASDKDLLQLVGDGIRVLNPSKNVVLDSAGVTESFGVPPERVRDVLGLMGDSVDNIPGVPGVGSKTALAAVSTYGGMDEIIERARRFVAAYDARDALLESIAAAAGQSELAEPAVATIVAEFERFDRDVAALAEHEPDSEFKQRLEAIRGELVDADVEDLPRHIGEVGRRGVKGLAGLKRALKGLDRGSSKRIWYSMVEHEDQARLSKQLASLDHAVPVALHPDSMGLKDPDPVEAQALFRTLGFKNLIDEFGASSAKVPDATTSARSEYRTVLTIDDLESVADACRRSGRVGLSVVAEGGDPMRSELIGIGLAPQPGTAVYVPLAHDAIGAPDPLDRGALSRVLGPLFADEKVSKVGHDLKTISHLLHRNELPLSGWGLDTMVAAFLLDSSRGSYTAARLFEEFLGRQPVDYDELVGSGAKRIEVGLLDVGQVTTYAAEASDLTLRLAADLESRLEETGLDSVYRTIDGPLLPLLETMERWGVRVDTEMLATMSHEMEDSLDAARVEIHRLAGEEFNIDSPKQLREILFEKMGLKSRRKTAKSRAASTDAQTLEELMDQHEIAAKILEYRELSKLKGTYVDSLPRLVHPDTGRVHTSYHPTGAATGRLSSSDPNMQNIPVRSEAGRRIRRAFVPDPGYVFLASDYSQIELRVLAHMAEDPELIAAFKAGEDIHRHTASKVFGVLPDLVTDPMRRRAKAINFGILYGMSETRLAREQGMSRADAKRFIQAYFDRFTRVREYIDRVRDEARNDGAVKTLFGRIRRFPQLHQRLNRAAQEQALRAAVNSTLQGTAADLMKMAMIVLDRRLSEARNGSRILLQVHDELLLEVPETAVEATGALVRDSMEGVGHLEVPLVVDQKTGSSWEEVT